MPICRAAWIATLLGGAVLTLNMACTGPVQAQEKDGTRSYDRSAPGSQTIRNFSVRNNSGETIDWAEIRLTDGTARTVTDQRVLTGAHAEVVGAPGKACLSEVHVRFQGGRKLDSAGLNDCGQTTISVLRNQIVLGSSARPGP